MQSEGNRDNPYSFDEFLEVRDRFDYYADDRFLQALVAHFCGPEAGRIDAELRALSPLVSRELRDLANTSGTLENRIRCTQVRHFDAFNHRIDAIERCAETERLERTVFGAGLFDPARNTPWSSLAKLFLLHENGEFGVMCPVACTDGMIMEFWEGPRNVLLTQIHRDLARVREWYPAAQLCRDLLHGADPAVVAPLADEFGRLMSHPSLVAPDAATAEVCRDRDRCSLQLCRAYQEQASCEVERHGRSFAR